MDLKTAERLAKEWMPGTREGSDRKAWEHPQDLVNLLDEVPGLDEQQLDRAKQIAWMHDLLEDGERPDQQRVLFEHLIQERFKKEIALSVLALTCDDLEDEEAYLKRLRSSDPIVVLVKCVDRICNLREGYLTTTFKHDRWLRYVGESLYFIYPLTDQAPEGSRRFLKKELLKATRIEPLSERERNQKRHTSSSSSKCS